MLILQTRDRFEICWSYGEPAAGLNESSAVDRLLVCRSLRVRRRRTLRLGSISATIVKIGLQHLQQLVQLVRLERVHLLRSIAEEHES